MPRDLIDRLSSISDKAQMLARKYQEVAVRRDEALQEATRLSGQVAMQQREIAQLKERLAYLEAALTLSPSREEVGRTRKLISNLVREIDRCILMLTSTPLLPDMQPDHDHGPKA